MSASRRKIKVVLGNYRGIRIPDMNVDVTEEEVQKELKRAQEKAGKRVPKSGKAAKGDEMLIDFSGLQNGQPIPGASGKNCRLVLGSGSFIPGFEEGLMGHAKGDHVRMELWFPKNHRAQNLAGKKAVFLVDVREVYGKELPEINDDLAKQVSQFDTLEEFKNYIRQEIRTNKLDQKKNLMMSKLIETCQVSIPAEEIDRVESNLVQNFQMQLKAEGLTLEQYLHQSKLTRKQFDQNARKQAEKSIQCQSILVQIAEKEKITVSEEEVNQQMTVLAKQYGLSTEAFSNKMGDVGKKAVRDSIASEKAMDFLIRNGVEK